MHPALSVIFFTVGSGAGLGLFVMLFLADAVGLGGNLEPGRIVLIGAAALALTAAGLTSSLFHLANPKNAWRAFGRFRTSWLSREGVFSVLFFPFAIAYLGLTWLALPGWAPARLAAGALAVLLAWATVFSTGMIYGCLKTIRQWNTPLVPANYLALAHFSGMLLLLALTPSAGRGGELAVAAVLLLIAAVLKALYYFWIASPGVGPTLGSATGFSRDRVTLLDAGHTHGTFLTEEFGYRAARRRLAAMKVLVFGAAFVLPLLALAAAGEGAGWAAPAAAAAALPGVLAERWLFFAEARHVVNLYHGAS